MRTNKEPSKTRLGLRLVRAMEAKNMTIRQLKDATEGDYTYEFIRGIAAGDRFPSERVLQALTNALGIPFKEAYTDLVADQLMKKWGGVPAQLAGKKPGMATIEKYWDTLTEAQQQDLTNMAIQWSERNHSLASV